jgi:cation diffusion facilitator family transporter
MKRQARSHAQRGATAAVHRPPIPPAIKRNTLLLAVTQAFVGVGNQMVPALGAIMVLQLLGSPALAGIATGILGGCRFLVAYPIGAITDRHGRRVGLVLGLLLSLLGALAIGWSMAGASFAVFLLGLVLFGLGVGAGQQLRVAAADMYPPSRRAEGLGYVLMGSLVGALGGPLLITLAEAWSPRLRLDPLALSWWLVPVVLLPSLGLVRLIRPDPKEIAANLSVYYPDSPEASPVSPGPGARVSVRRLLRYQPQRVACITSFALHGNMSMIMAMTSLALTHAGHTLPAISFAVAIHVIGMFGLSLPLGHLADRVGRRNVMLGGTVAAGAGSVCVSLSSAYWVVTAGTFLVGLGWSCMNIAVVALFADTTQPQERGRVLGVNDALTATASIGLPLLAGPLVALAGLESLAVASVGLLLVPLILLLRLHEPSPGTYGMPAAHALGQEDMTLCNESLVTPSSMEVTYMSNPHHPHAHAHARHHDAGTAHRHTHGPMDPTILTTQRGIWAIKWSLVGLGATALIQVMIVWLSGSVALLADTIHNIGDAATALPLWMAFVLARRPPSQRFTYGLGRVEDLAGVIIVGLILCSAIVAGYQALSRLLNPQPIAYLGLVAVAALIGFLGNEAVALFRLKVGKEIGSAALIADGYHARVDGWTSLAVFVGTIGAWFGYPIIDSIVGFVIALAILRIGWESGVAIFTRLLDGVEPTVLKEIRHAVRHTPEVHEVTQVRVRWVGHRLHAELNIAVRQQLSVAQGHAIATEVQHQLLYHMPHLAHAMIHVDPVGASGEEHHRMVQHVHGDLPAHAHL